MPKKRKLMDDTAVMIRCQPHTKEALKRLRKRLCAFQRPSAPDVAAMFERAPEAAIVDAALILASLQLDGESRAKTKR